ncbi:MAG: hypothetical protein AAFZ15_24820 [Bacteroidota bacterium]
MAKSFKQSIFAKLLKRVGVLDNISRSDFDSDEDYESCKRKLIEGSKNILIENDGSLERSLDHFSKIKKNIKKSTGNHFDIS